MRALENFPISKRPSPSIPTSSSPSPRVKQAAARANREVGVLDRREGRLIDEACQRIIDGELHDQFVVGVIQGGAGTSTNMNANEVIANVALEIDGSPKGALRHPAPDRRRQPQPVDERHLPDRAQARHGVRAASDCSTSSTCCRVRSPRKGREFADVLKVGRTQLQDAVPMTLGQEFHGFATTLGEDSRPPHRDHQAADRDQPGRHRDRHRHHRRPAATREAVPSAPRATITGLSLETAPDLIEATSDAGVFMTLSGTLKRSAIKLSKICNDLRLLSSGPAGRASARSTCPPRQAGRASCRARSTRSSPRS